MKHDYNLFSAETQTKIQQARQKALDGSITTEELIEAIKLMRQDRTSAITAAATATRGKSKAKSANINVDDILAEF